MKNSKMGLGGSGTRQENSKKSTSPVGHAKVANVTARPGWIAKHEKSDALKGCCGHSPVKAQGK
jgi:hypothetical protein